LPILFGLHLVYPRWALNTRGGSELKCRLEN